MTAATQAREATAVVRNGVDVDALNATIAAIEETPVLATFRFRATNRWLGGDRNRSTVDGFFGACEEHRRKTPFTVENGEPAVLFGADQAPNPLEQLLNALLACVTTSIAYHGAARGHDVGAIESAAEGDLDMRGSLGLDAGVRKGFSAIRVRVKARSQAAAAELHECALMSPVLDVVSRSVPVTLEVETA